jgi:putative ABC transport system ATP-binding protein
MVKLWHERGMTMVVVTHDTQVARQAPRTALINKGALTLRDNLKKVARNRSVPDHATDVEEE